jgi:hypothetical protein
LPPAAFLSAELVVMAISNFKNERFLDYNSRKSPRSPAVRSTEDGEPATQTKAIRDRSACHSMTLSKHRRPAIKGRK